MLGGAAGNVTSLDGNATRETDIRLSRPSAVCPDCNNVRPLRGVRNAPPHQQVGSVIDRLLYQDAVKVDPHKVDVFWDVGPQRQSTHIGVMSCLLPPRSVA